MSFLVLLQVDMIMSVFFSFVTNIKLHGTGSTQQYCPEQRKPWTAQKLSTDAITNDG